MILVKKITVMVIMTNGIMLIGDKFGLTAGSVLLLLLHQFGAIGRIAQLVLSSPEGVLPAASSTESGLAVKAGLAVLVLLVTTTLSIYKPWGLTPYGRRIQQKRSAQLNAASGSLETALPDSGETATRSMPTALKIFLAATVLLIGVFAMLHHLSGHVTGHHHF